MAHTAAGGTGYDSFVMRLIYEGPTGRLLGPQIAYEVRIRSCECLTWQMRPSPCGEHPAGVA